jgi:hypothetical protein
MNKKPLKVAIMGAGSMTGILAKALAGGATATFTGTLDEKRLEINRILDEAEKALQTLECKYFLAAIDHDVRDTDGGKVFINSEHNGADMAVIMQHAFPANKDLIYLGVSVGNEIMRRNKESIILFREKKRKAPKKVVTPNAIAEELAATATPRCLDCGALNDECKCNS